MVENKPESSYQEVQTKIDNDSKAKSIPQQGKRVLLIGGLEKSSDNGEPRKTFIRTAEGNVYLPIEKSTSESDAFKKIQTEIQDELNKKGIGNTKRVIAIGGLEKSQDENGQRSIYIKTLKGKIVLPPLKKAS
jgi:DUF4097 and DUF4098 domain-containing protein YvlB